MPLATLVPVTKAFGSMIFAFCRRAVADQGGVRCPQCTTCGWRRRSATPHTVPLNTYGDLIEDDSTAPAPLPACYRDGDRDADLTIRHLSRKLGDPVRVSTD
jgi:hypothetical protein